MPGQRIIALVVVFVAGLGAGAGLMYYYLGLSKSDRGERTIGTQSRPCPNRVTARGRLEPASGVVNLGAAGPDILTEIKVSEGDTVKLDQVLAVLASQAVRKIEVDAAKIQLDEAVE